MHFPIQKYTLLLFCYVFLPNEKLNAFVIIFRVRLIASVPGRHTGLNKTKWGHLKLRKARLFALLTIREATSLEKIVEKIVKRMSQSKAYISNEQNYNFFAPSCS